MTLFWFFLGTAIAACIIAWCICYLINDPLYQDSDE